MENIKMEKENKFPWRIFTSKSGNLQIGKLLKMNIKIE